MRLGVLDVGSNTVHLLVVDAHRGAHPWPAYQEKSCCDWPSVSMVGSRSR
jgi:exopolyphosphatase/pppGpp-phosphohydrolase